MILKFALLTQVIAKPWVLIAMPILSRWVFLIGVKSFPYVREQGLGKGFNNAVVWPIFIIEGIVILSLIGVLAGLTGFLPVLGTILFTILFCHRVSNLLGGLTGDIYGATIEMSEVLFLLIASVTL